MICLNGFGQLCLGDGSYMCCNVVETILELVWNMFGTCLGLVGNLCFTLFEPLYVMVFNLRGLMVYVLDCQSLVLNTVGSGPVGAKNLHVRKLSN